MDSRLLPPDEWPESTKHLRTRPDISEETRAKIGGANAKRFYALS